MRPTLLSLNSHTVHSQHLNLAFQANGVKASSRLALQIKERSNRGSKNSPNLIILSKTQSFICGLPLLIGRKPPRQLQTAGDNRRQPAENRGNPHIPPKESQHGTVAFLQTYRGIRNYSMPTSSRSRTKVSSDFSKDASDFSPGIGNWHAQTAPNWQSTIEEERREN